jgi:endoglucanase
MIYWDNGSRGRGRECSGIIDHSNGDYISGGEEIVRIMVDAYNMK